MVWYVYIINISETIKIKSWLLVFYFVIGNRKLERGYSRWFMSVSRDIVLTTQIKKKSKI